MKFNQSKKQEKKEEFVDVGLPSKSAALLKYALLRRVMACFLGENTFYTKGSEVMATIRKQVLQKEMPLSFVISLARKSAKTGMRNTPLYLLVCAIEAYNLDKTRLPHPSIISQAIFDVIERPDSIATFVSLYWMDGKKPLSKQVKIGLAKAFVKFNAYTLAKHRSERLEISLRDVAKLVWPSEMPKELLTALWNNTLETPDTWEVALSKGEDKTTVFRRLIKEKKLGALALLRNMRNMEALIDGKNEDRSLIRTDIINRTAEGKWKKIWPYQFLKAIQYAPSLADVLDSAMISAVSGEEKLPGRTLLLVDVSGSMDYMLSTASGKDGNKRIDVACGLAVYLREICEDISVYSFSNEECLIPNYQASALAKAITGSQDHSATYLKKSLSNILGKSTDWERIIVITDEQSQDGIVTEGIPERSYVINVSTDDMNLETKGQWVQFTGFSDSIIDFIRYTENGTFDRWLMEED